MPADRRSKRLSYWLRHSPEAGGLQLDGAGWASTEAVLNALRASELQTSLDELKALIRDNDKQRFELSPDASRVRARQGHSVDVAGDWPTASPPQLLYHGTTERFLGAILEQGLLPGARHHVHLSSTIASALAVGARRGRPRALSVAAGRMAADSFVFRLSSNGVWLTDHVPPAYLELLREI
jgi:putative RNA 2'-phosphotransferase